MSDTTRTDAVDHEPYLRVLQEGIEAIDTNDPERFSLVVATILANLKTLHPFVTFFSAYPTTTLALTAEDTDDVTDRMIERLTSFDLAEKDIRNYVDEHLRMAKPRRSLTRRRFVPQVTTQLAVTFALYLEAEQLVDQTRHQALEDLTGRTLARAAKHGF